MSAHDAVHSSDSALPHATSLRGWNRFSPLPSERRSAQRLPWGIVASVTLAFGLFTSPVHAQLDAQLGSPSETPSGPPSTAPSASTSSTPAAHTHPAPLAPEHVAQHATAAAPSDDANTDEENTEENEEDCEEEELNHFDPSQVNFEMQIGGGYSVFALTWRQSDDIGAIPTIDGTPMPDGLYQGGVFRGELALGLGPFFLSALYTEIVAEHSSDTGITRRNMQIVSGEFGLQCACRESIYVWSFSIEVGWNIADPALLVAIEHRSTVYVWEGLFLGFDFDASVLYGLTTGGPSGGGLIGTLFLGYSIE